MPTRKLFPIVLLLGSLFASAAAAQEPRTEARQSTEAQRTQAAPEKPKAEREHARAPRHHAQVHHRRIVHHLREHARTGTPLGPREREAVKRFQDRHPRAAQAIRERVREHVEHHPVARAHTERKHEIRRHHHVERQHSHQRRQRST